MLLSVAMALAFATVSATSTTPLDLRIGVVPEDLVAKHLTLPVEGVKAKDLRPDFYDARGARGHEAIDIPAARGQPVLAVEDGRIAKLFLSKPGGITIYQFDPASKYAYYYAHLDRYADGLAEGMSISRGQIIGYVGSTGNADARYPHLHFGIFQLGPEAQWWRGEALDPYPALNWQ
jgi:murein DD-endopeptidase MepM/ murein hydrolase activator NlpD